MHYIKCILTLHWTLGYTEYFHCWNSAMRYAMQE